MADEANKALAKKHVKPLEKAAVVPPNQQNKVTPISVCQTPGIVPTVIASPSVVGGYQMRPQIISTPFGLRLTHGNTTTGLTLSAQKNTNQVISNNLINKLKNSIVLTLLKYSKCKI